MIESNLEVSKANRANEMSKLIGLMAEPSAKH